MATKDITTRADILLLMEAFYTKVKADPVIGIIFTEIIPLDWEHHIPLITDFWETILLDNPLYHSNAMAKHAEIHRIYPLEKKHFDAWLALFNSTLDENFAGPVAELARKRAKGIAGVMQHSLTGKNRLHG